MKFTRILISIFLANSLYIRQSIGDELQKPQAMIDYIKSLDKPIELRGDFLKAAMIAYNEDFSKLIEQYKRQSSIDKNAEENTPHLAFLSKLENYDVLIELRGKDYSISFGPTVRGDALEVFGGGAQYLIDGKTFKIKEKKYSK
jgi:hypothetical protein